MHIFKCQIPTISYFIFIRGTPKVHEHQKYLSIPIAKYISFSSEEQQAALIWILLTIQFS